MDAREYDRIADLLMQIRKKVANNVVWTNTKGKWTIEEYLRQVSTLLVATDALAHADQQGLI